MTDFGSSGEVQIAVIIPAFNVANYLSEAIDSALRQRPPFSQVIVVDDGSTDNTREIISGYADSRIHYHYQNNQGLGPARNTGIELSNAEYIYFMDGDDVLEDGMTRFVQTQIELQTRRPDAILFSALDFKHETGETSSSSEYFERRNVGNYTSGREALLSSLQLKSNPACAFLYVIKRSVLNSSRPLRFLNILHEDEVFTPSLLLRCKDTVVTNQIVYRRRIRRGSIMSSAASERNANGYFAAAENWLSIANASSGGEANLYRDQAHRFYGHAIRYAARAKLGLGSTRQLAAKVSPYFKKYVVVDYLVSFLSRRLAFEIIRLRRKIGRVFDN